MPRFRVLTDLCPEILARRERRIAERIARHERGLTERLLGLIGLEPERCPICGARTEESRTERCRGACEGG
jgi:hypothetical protein